MTRKIAGILWSLSACGGPTAASAAGSSDAQTSAMASETAEASTTGGPMTDGADTGSAETTTFGETAMSGSDSMVTTASTGEVFVCEDEHVCAPASPTQWAGPYAVLHASAATPVVACPAPFEEVQGTWYWGLSGGSHSCGCACGTVTGMSCANTATLRYHGTSSTCLGSGTATTVGNILCNSSISYPASRYFRVAPLVASGGSCTPQPSSNIGQPSFSDRVIACAGPLLAQGCGVGELCVPRPSEPLADALCVVRSGEHDCPDSYPDRLVVYDDYTDTRGCATCTCSNPTGTCTGGHITLFGQDGCTGLGAGTIPANSTCTQTAAVAAESALLNTTNVTLSNASCQWQQASPATIGSLAPVDPTTICCRTPGA
jgi:hypothetical protein